MDEINFCHWLQGFFKILNPKVTNGTQVNEIKNHLSVVEENSNGLATEFVKWLKESISFSPDLSYFDERQTQIIKDRLSQVFQKDVNQTSYYNLPAGELPPPIKLWSEHMYTC